MSQWELPTFNGLQYASFVVDATPYCFWDPDLARHNIEFLDAIDPGYFDYIASTLPDGDAPAVDKYLATNLRLGYSHALETLFSLLAAYVQAPHCPLGWLLAYQNFELLSVVRKINRGRGGFRSAWNQPKPTWLHLSEAVHAPMQADLRGDVVQGFAHVWGRFASDFTSDEFSQEYNSLKHGLRSVSSPVK